MAAKENSAVTAGGLLRRLIKSAALPSRLVVPSMPALGRIVRRSPAMSRLLDRYRDMVGRRAERAAALYFSQSPIPLRGHVSGSEFSRADTRALKNYLLGLISSGKISGRPKGELRRLVDSIKFTLGRGSDRAAPDPYGLATPGVELIVHEHPTLGKFIDAKSMLHEVGHLIDLHGTNRGIALHEANRTNSLRTRGFWEGEISNPETRANQLSGLPKITPGIDSYYAAHAEPRGILYLMQKYRPEHPNLPK